MGVSSGIAAFKVISLVKSLKKRGYNVIVIMTEHAKKMISEKEFEKASGNKVVSELFPKGFDYKRVLKERKVKHISLADMASVIIVVPATANIIAKIANGVADDILTTTILASKAELLVCPSMNVNMWNNKVTQENLKKLGERNAFLVEPESGLLACGYRGKGRLADIKKIEESIIKLATKRNELAGIKAIVTAGGTEEEIDSVRVITNKSSGKMGIAIACELAKRGAEITLIRGRTDVEPIILLNDIKVRSADEMFQAIKKNIKKNGIIVHAAAVSDFRVKKKRSKIKSGKKINMKLIPNIKIITEIKKMKKDIFLVGFKAEHGAENLVGKALKSLRDNSANMVVANDISKNVFGSDYNSVWIVDDSGLEINIKRAKKEKIAEKIVDEIKKKV
ncbi:MAG: bifunctional phosphopantothenoylcysteine decarboxylase/phosphopantothenate--cysteine ligase CoaBC [Deltaproteobacteria bacterium]|nr:bifunctional phosphopantothenoylcysteine decarboxylase/phosphopantothenate--cysteine ligase CoaBC [Deltaproteobacteria bacterium]